MAEPTAQDLFFTRAGLDEKRVARIVDDALQGADDGELFLEYRQSESFSFDDGRLKSASFDTTQGTYWRPQAVAACEAIVGTCGGVVAEDRGLVRLIVPPEWAVEAHAKLAAVCLQRTGHYDGTANEMALVSAGVGKLVPTRGQDGVLRLRMEPIEARCVPVRSIEVTEGGDGRATVTVWTDGSSVIVRVPLDWASSDKQRWHTIAQVDHDVVPGFDKDDD